MREGDDDLFIEIGLAQKILTERQARELRETLSALEKIHMPRRAAQIASERRMLTPREITSIQRELRKRGVFPKLGGYEILGKLGQGGMGAVYKARQISLDRAVALKVLRRELGVDRTYVERFRREGRLAAKISHPNAVQVYNVGESGGQHFMSMEFVDGTDVAKEVERGPMDETRALEIVLGVARALAVAHERGIIHRDIKPANIMLTPAGTAKLADLGIAKQTGAAGESLTRSGAVVGTAQYMSPEQCLGERELDGRSDIYSLGTTLFHMVCGCVPFDGESNMAIMRKHVDEPLPDPRFFNPELSPGTATLIRRMMAKAPGDRFQTCQELIDAIEHVDDLAGLAPEPVGAEAPSRGGEGPAGRR